MAERNRRDRQHSQHKYYLFTSLLKNLRFFIIYFKNVPPLFFLLFPSIPLKSENFVSPFRSFGVAVCMCVWLLLPLTQNRTLFCLFQIRYQTPIGANEMEWPLTHTIEMIMVHACRREEKKVFLVASKSQCKWWKTHQIQTNKQCCCFCFLIKRKQNGKQQQSRSFRLSQTPIRLVWPKMKWQNETTRCWSRFFFISHDRFVISIEPIKRHRENDEKQKSDSIVWYGGLYRAHSVVYSVSGRRSVAPNKKKTAEGVPKPNRMEMPIARQLILTYRLPCALISSKSFRTLW